MAGDASLEGLEPWDGLDIESLLRLRQSGPSTFRNRQASPNERGTVFGGQLLAHALMAASMAAPPGRDVTALQFMFLQSAVPARPIDYEVTTLQDGKRFASRHVRGTQRGEGSAGARIVLDAQVTFALPLDGPVHATPSRAGVVDPETLPRLEDQPQARVDAVWRALGYPVESAVLDVRLADPDHDLGVGGPAAALRMWMRLRRALPNEPALQASAFAFLSDWWTNFASVGIHVPELLEEGTRLHVASLNHAIWFHQPFRGDGWLHFDIQSPRAQRGRGLSVATVHDIDGVLVATVTQENLMTPGNL
jgi:acyl-CoA thioesterase-2